MASDDYNPEEDFAHEGGDSPSEKGIKWAGHKVTGFIKGTVVAFVVSHIPALLLVVAIWLTVMIPATLVSDYVANHPYITAATSAAHFLNEFGKKVMYNGKVMNVELLDGEDGAVSEMSGFTGEELLSDPYYDADKLAQWNGARDYEGQLKKGLAKTTSGNGVGIDGEMTELSDEEIQNASSDVIALARTIWGEAAKGGYDADTILKGKIAVAMVVKNRMERDGQSAYYECTKKNQFSGYWDHISQSTSTMKGFDECVNIAYNVLNGNLSLSNFEGVVGFRSDKRPETHGGGSYYTSFAGHHFYSNVPHDSTDIGVVDNGSENVILADADIPEGDKKEDPTLVGIWSKYLKDVKDLGILYEGGERGQNEEGKWMIKDPVLQLADNTSSIAAQQDIIDITEFAAKYNNRMFELGDIYYQYLQWALVQREAKSAEGTGTGEKVWMWEKTFPIKSTSGINSKGDDDGLYDHVSREHIEGEEDAEGHKKFMVWWQELQGLYYILSSSNGEVRKVNGWGETGDDYEYDSKKHDDRYDDPLDTDGYFASDDSIEEIENLLAYQFDYYYDAVKLTSRRTSDNAYMYESKADQLGLEAGDYIPIAYRYKRLPDPDPLGPFTTKPDVSPAPYTRFVMESAPNTISNSFTTYKYIYVPVSELQGVEAENGTFNYTPDPDVYEPPQGYYCIGRYKIVNPGPFIDALASIEPYFYKGATDADGAKRVAIGYEWAVEQMREFVEWTSQLPVFEDSYEYFMQRMDMYTDLGRMYMDKKIEITYEGVLYDDIYDEEDVEKFIENYKKVLPSKYSSWHFPTAAKVIKNPASKISKKFLDPDAFPSSYPFWSYGVTFWNNRDLGEQAIFLTDQEYDRTTSWTVTYDEQLESELGVGEWPFGEGDLADFYQFYINQSDSDVANIIRGASGKRVQASGCLDCSVAMIASFWQGQKVNVANVSKYTAVDGSLNAPAALAQYGLKQSDNIYGNFSSGVASEIDAGRPVIVHIRHQWVSVDGTVLHPSDSGHFLVACGYNDQGIIVADPGRRANHLIKKEDWENLERNPNSDLYYRTVTPIS